MDDLVSIIVPVCNGEDYIGTCLESLQKQSYSNLELIVVDDGSGDRTAEICAEHARRDPRIRLLSQTNGGVSAARNRGMLAADGAFIGFVDSDDYPEPGFIDCLYTNAVRHRVSISACSYNFVVNGRKHPIPVTADKKSGKLNKMDFYTGLMEDTYRGFLWNKLFRRSLLTDAGGALRLLNQDLGICEDLLYVAGAASLGESFYFDRRCFYNYVQRGESAYNSGFHPGKLSELDAYDGIMEIIGREAPECLAEYRRAYLNMALKLNDAYRHAPARLRDGHTKQRIEEAISRYYSNVMACDDVSLRRKLFYSMYRKSPRLIRGIKTMHHRVVYH